MQVELKRHRAIAGVIQKRQECLQVRLGLVNDAKVQAEAEAQRLRVKADFASYLQHELAAKEEARRVRKAAKFAEEARYTTDFTGQDAAKAAQQAAKAADAKSMIDSLQASVDAKRRAKELLKTAEAELDRKNAAFVEAKLSCNKQRIELYAQTSQ